MCCFLISIHAVHTNVHMLNVINRPPNRRNQLFQSNSYWNYKVVYICTMYICFTIVLPFLVSKTMKSSLNYVLFELCMSCLKKRVKKQILWYARLGHYLGAVFLLLQYSNSYLYSSKLTHLQTIYRPL